MNNAQNRPGFDAALEAAQLKTQATKDTYRNTVKARKQKMKVFGYCAVAAAGIILMAAKLVSTTSVSDQQQQ